MATDDLKDFFNQLRLAPQEWWKCCCQWPGLIDDPDASSFVAEYVLGFGLGCSSGIAQRFGDLLMATVRKRFDREEAQLAHERGGRRPEPDRGYNVAEFEKRAAETQRLVGSGKPPTTLPGDRADAHRAARGRAVRPRGDRSPPAGRGRGRGRRLGAREDAAHGRLPTASRSRD